MNIGKFGFSIHKDRQINLDIADRSVFHRVSLIEPSINRCIFCGGCSSTCSAGMFTDMSFRRTSLFLRRGMNKEAKELIKKCLLCGKCSMVCPRDINIRHIMIILKKEIETLNG